MANNLLGETGGPAVEVTQWIDDFRDQLIEMAQLTQRPANWVSELLSTWTDHDWSG
jgi:hypothetical protein